MPSVDHSQRTSSYSLSLFCVHPTQCFVCPSSTLLDLQTADSFMFSFWSADLSSFVCNCRDFSRQPRQNAQVAPVMCTVCAHRRLPREHCSQAFMIMMCIGLTANECRLAKQCQSQCATCLSVLCFWAKIIFGLCLHSVLLTMLCSAMQATYYDSRPAGSHSCLNLKA